MTEPESLSLSLNSVAESSAYLSLSRWHLKEWKMRWRQHAATIVTLGAETLCGSARKHMLASRAWPTDREGPAGNTSPFGIGRNPRRALDFPPPLIQVRIC